MPAAPPPIEPLDPALFVLEPDPPDQEDQATHDAEEYDAWVHLLTDQHTNTSSTDLQPNIDVIEPTFAPAAELLDSTPLDDLASRDPDVEGNSPEVDERIVRAVAAMPGEGWQDPPAPFEPPVDDPGFDPEDSDRRVPDRTPPPAPAVVQVGISNSSRIGAPDFRVGDWVRVDVQGPPGGIVGVEAWQDGALLGSLYWPDKPVNEAGRWHTDAFMTDDVVGTWVEVWRVAEVQADPVLYFEVLPG